MGWAYLHTSLELAGGKEGAGEADRQGITEAIDSSGNPEGSLAYLRTCSVEIQDTFHQSFS